MYIYIYILLVELGACTITAKGSCGKVEKMQFTRIARIWRTCAQPLQTSPEFTLKVAIFWYNHIQSFCIDIVIHVIYDMKN